MSVCERLFWLGVHCLVACLTFGPHTRGNVYYLALSCFNGFFIGGSIGTLIFEWQRCQRVAADEWKE